MPEAWAPSCAQAQGSLLKRLRAACGRMTGSEGRICCLEATTAKLKEKPSPFFQRLGIYQPLAWGFPAVLLLMCGCRQSTKVETASGTWNPTKTL